MTNNDNRISTGTIQKYTKSIIRGIYDVPEEDLENIVLKLQQGKALNSDEWIDLSNAFFVKIYNDLPKYFGEAVRIRRSKKLNQTNAIESQAKAIIKLYKDNIR